MRWVRVVPVVLVAVLSGCTGAAEPAVTAGAQTTPSQQTVSPSPVASPSASAQPSETPTPVAEAAWPPATTAVVHGGERWAVYVAVTDSGDDPRVAAAQERLDALGYASATGWGDVGCDDGAAEALGVPWQSTAVRVYFDTQADAETFARLYGPEAVGTAQVTLYCLD